MKLDLKGWKKVHSEKTHTVLQNAQGHQLKIAHSAVEPKMRSRLAELPLAEQAKEKKSDNSVKMADGGEVPDPDPKAAKEVQKGATESGWAPEKWIQNAKEGLGMEKPKASPRPQKFADGGEAAAEPTPQPQAAPTESPMPEASATPAPTPNQAAPQAPVVVNVNTPGAASPPPGQPMAAEAPAAAAPQAPQGQQPAMPASPQAPVVPATPPPDPYGVNAYGQAYGTGLAEQKAGLAQQAQAEGQLGQAQAKQLQAGIQHQQAQAADYQQNFKAIEQDQKHFMEDYKNQHIDPNHYWASQSTGGKISTILGILAGGFNFTDRPNAGLEMFNNAINRDIDAQKAEMGKKENLMSANFKRFGNLRDATDMTRAMQLGIVSDKLKMEAAKAATPMAKAKMLEEAGKIDKEAAAVIGQQAMRKTILSGASQGKIAPEQVIRAFVPEGQQDAHYKDLAEAQHLNKVQDNVLSGFDKLTSLTTVGSAFSPQAHKQKAAVESLLAGLSKDTAGKFTEQDAEYLSKQLPAYGDGAETTALKRGRLMGLLREKMNFPRLKALNIDPTGQGGRYNAQGASKYQESAPVLPTTTKK